MDIIDRFANFLGSLTSSRSGRKPAVRRAPAPAKRTVPEKRPAEDAAVSAERCERLAESIARMRQESELGRRQSQRRERTEQNRRNRYYRKSVGERFEEEEGRKLLNSLYADHYWDTYFRKYNLGDKNLLEKKIPFVNRKKDWGEWAYRNRAGLFAMVFAYLLTLLAVGVVRFQLNDIDVVRNAVMIQFPTDEEPEIREEEKEKIRIEEMQGEAWRADQVTNVAVDQNTKLNASLRDSRNTDTKELYKDAADLQKELAQSREAYQRGLQEVANMKRAPKQGADNRGGNARENNEASVQDGKTEGNVTVSYDLAGRKAVFLEVPAYRCEGGGKVVVEITVTRVGKVADASVRSVSGGSEECISEMALWAARRTLFDSKEEAPARQKGTITYIFVAQ